MVPTEYSIVPEVSVFLRNRGQLLTGWRSARGQDRCRRLGMARSARGRSVRRTNGGNCRAFIKLAETAKNSQGPWTICLVLRKLIRNTPTSPTEVASIGQATNTA